MRHKLRVLGLLVLAGLFPGCQDRPGVKVSGAVERPGEYAYQPEWLPVDYVTAAGGTLSEADVSKAYGMRVKEDATGAKTIAYDKAQRWPIKQAPALMPGDEIILPYLSYSIGMDTVRAVEDVEVTWRGRIHRTPKGFLVPGWTERGVLFAVIIGDGVIIKEDGGDRLGTYHYLYLHMHPDRFGGLIPKIGAAVVDREMLEDAAEVHGALFQKSAYCTGAEARMPPEDYLHLRAGVWLMVKSRSFPGPGMRKRRYEDGRELTTFPDGRQRMKRLDGLVVVDFPGGGKETRHPDGRTTFRDASGNLQTQYPDGREVWEMASGNRTTLYPDGRRVHEDTSGTVRRVFPDGTERSVFADGSRHVQHPNGREEVRTPSGHFEIRFPDGRKLVTTPEGHRVTVHPDGRQLSELADGTTVEIYPDGSKIQRNSTGEVLRISVDGERRTTYPDGSEVTQGADGARVVRSHDGGVAETYPDGRRVDMDGRGNRIESFPDGRKVYTDAEGSRVERLPDGTMLKTSAAPYRYLGAVGSGLLEMDEVPGRVAPGDVVHLSGMVTGDDVRTLHVAAFRLPDGDVSDIQVGRDGTRFQAKLRAGKAGRYIVQVSAEMEDEKIVILDDRMLTVGHPPPLEAPTIEVPPYPGSDAAAQKLLELTNEARKRLGRQGLPEDARLSQVAREHVVEMLSIGFVGHLSPTSGTIADRLGRREIWFRTTTENLGHAASVEELHDQLMASAGHRRNILDPTWTRIGLAVTRNWGEVWGVQVFYRD